MISAETLHTATQNELRQSHHYIMTDAQNRTVAGLTVSEEFRVRAMHIPFLPSAHKWINKVTRFIPPANELRPVTCYQLWHLPDSDDAAEQLCRAVNRHYRDSADVFLFTHAADSPLKKVVPSPFWLPNGSLSLASSEKLDRHHPIYPLR